MFDSCVTLCFGQNRRAMQVSTLLTLGRVDFDVIFQQINLNTGPTFPLQNLASRILRMFFDPQRSFGNPLRALFLKNRDFFCHGEISSLIRGDLYGASSRFGRLGQNPAGAIIRRSLYNRLYALETPLRW